MLSCIYYYAVVCDISDCVYTFRVPCRPVRVGPNLHAVGQLGGPAGQCPAVYVQGSGHLLSRPQRTGELALNVRETDLYLLVMLKVKKIVTG